MFRISKPTLRDVLEPFITKENLLSGNYHFELNLENSKYTAIHHIRLTENSGDENSLNIKTHVEIESDYENLKKKLEISFKTYLPNAFKFCKYVEETDKSYIFTTEIKCSSNNLLNFVISWADAIQSIIQNVEKICIDGAN
jgi:hypothetical protein